MADADAPAPPDSLTRVPASVDDHHALHAELLAAKRYDDAFDVRYLTKQTREGPKLCPNGRKFTETTQFQIKHRPVWDGVYPQLREFLQNAFDHLCLCDAHGFRLPWVELRVAGDSAARYTMAFRVGNEDVLTLRARDADTLVISQKYTYPLPPDVLQFRASDDLKRQKTGAGGFGVGFKEAIAAILDVHVRAARERGALDAAKAGDGAVVYEMHTAERKVTWSFKSDPRTKPSLRGYGGAARPCLQAHCGVSAAYARGSSADKVDTLVITIKLPDVVAGLLHDVVPKCTAFFAPPEPAKTIATPGVEEPCVALVAGGGVVLAPGLVLAPAPAAGVYARGLWVKKESRLGDGMLFCGRGAANVTSDMRNDVQGDTLRKNLVQLFLRAHRGGNPLPARIVGVLAGKGVDDATRCFLPGAAAGEFGFVAKAIVDQGREQVLQLLDLEETATFFEAPKGPREAYLLDALQKTAPRQLFLLGDEKRDGAFCDAKPASEAEALWREHVAVDLAPSGSPFEAILYECLRFAGLAGDPSGVVAVAMPDARGWHAVHLIKGETRLYALRSAPHGLASVAYDDLAELATTIIARYPDDRRAHSRLAFLLQRLPREESAVKDPLERDAVAPAAFKALIDTMLKELLRGTRCAPSDGSDDDVDMGTEEDDDDDDDEDEDEDDDDDDHVNDDDADDVVASWDPPVVPPVVPPVAPVVPPAVPPVAPVVPRPPPPVVDLGDATALPEELRRLLSKAQEEATRRHDEYEGGDDVLMTAPSAPPVNGVHVAAGVDPSVVNTERTQSMLERIQGVYERFPLPSGIEPEFCTAYEPATGDVGYAGCFCPPTAHRRAQLFVNAAVCGPTEQSIVCTVAHEVAHAVMDRDGRGGGHTHAFRLKEQQLQDEAFDLFYGQKRPRADGPSKTLAKRRK